MYRFSKCSFARALLSFFVCAFFVSSCSTIRVVARDSNTGTVSVSTSPSQPVNVTITNEGNSAEVLNKAE